MFETIRSCLRRYASLHRPVRLEPECRWTASANDNTATVIDDKGQTRALDFVDLGGIAIETNDSGPWGADLWWLLFAHDGTLALSWPQGATGEDAVIGRLTAITGFDHRQMTAAMASTDNATFVLWPCATVE